MASLSDDVIDELEDLMSARLVMKEYNLEVKGVKSLEMAKMKLRLHQAAQNPATVAHGPDPDIISHLINKDSTRREMLLGHLEQVAAFVNDLPQARKNELITAFPQMDNEMARARDQLRNEHCVILVAGETSAGKSSLLNLLLGETNRNLLPVAHLSCSSVICELKYGVKPRGIAHPWSDDDTSTIKELDLDIEGAEEELSDHIYQKQKRGQRFPYKRVEIFWPCEWLKNGVSIIDSPGVGESEEMTDLVKDYLPKAFGFMYVINCANAGGVQPDRLQDLLFAHLVETKKYQEEGWQFDPNSVIFICNKWDLIKVSERPEVKSFIINQLQECWPGFFEKQMFLLSTAQALESLKHGQVNSDYGRLLKGIENLLPIGLNQKITKYFRFVSQLLDKAASIIKTHITQLEISELDREEIVKKATERLTKVAERPLSIKAEMRVQMEQEIQHGISEVRKFLQTPEVINRLISWHVSDCPSTDKFSLLEDLTIAYAIKRIRNEVNRWEKETRLFENIQNRIIAAFQDKFMSVKSELEEIENSLMSKDKHALDLESMASAQTDMDDVELGLKGKVLLGATAPVWIPVGLIVGMFALPVYGIKTALRKRKNKKQLEKYSQNKAIEMASVTKHILGEITGGGKLEELIEDKISACLAVSEELAARIPNMINADLLILKNLQTEMQNAGKDLIELTPLREKSMQLQGRLDKFYIEKIRTYDIDIADLNMWDETTDVVAEGQFGIVFKTSRVVNGMNEDIALKKAKFPLSEENASEFLLEEYNLRKLQKPYIIRYIGTLLQKNKDGLYPIMVMEFCENNLQNIIYNRDSYSPPGDYPEIHRKPHLIKATQLAHQLSQGLRAIHTSGFVHRDLKPANILVTSSGHLRLADLGLSREEKKITGTIAGTPLYMAPDVVFSGIYDRKVDIFSYGLILWELWYGKCVYDVYKVTNYESFLRNAFSEHSPDEVWRPVMSNCLLKEPAARPNITECNKIFGTYEHNLAAF